MAVALKSRYSVRESHRLGFGEGCARHATILNRVVSLGELNGRRYVQIEPDKRHVELIVSSLGLDKSNTKSVTTPSVKPSDAEAAQFQHGPKLSASETSLYRSCVMRASFLSQDRADLGESVKALAQGMAAPTRAHLQALKRLGRFLLHRPTVAVRFWQQAFCPTITCMVDSDNAADRITRKSTTGVSCTCSCMFYKLCSCVILAQVVLASEKVKFFVTFLHACESHLLWSSYTILR